MTHHSRKAAALRYNSEKNTAPVLSAAGKNLIAEEIIEQAMKNDIPIIEDATLVELLAELNINEAIPDELYMAVAEVFAFIYRAEKEISNQK